MYCGFGITVISLWVMVFSTEGLVFRTDLKCGVYKVRCVGCMVYGVGYRDLLLGDGLVRRDQGKVPKP